MKLKAFTSVLCTAVLAVSVLSGCSSAPAPTDATAVTTQDAVQTAAPEKDTVPEDDSLKSQGGMTSQEYVEAMGHGWNLGNSFDGVNTDESEEDTGETAWGNPVVTRELIHAVKEKGFDSIRIPLTLFRRYDSEDGNYTIDPDWLARYKEVVDWAVEEDMYVMANIHHDSWIWLKYWDGKTDSEEYVSFVKRGSSWRIF